MAGLKRSPDVVERIRGAIGSDDKPGRFLWATLSELFLYAANRIPETCDDIVAVDTTMRAGFNWQAGIFEIWNGLGAESVAERMKSDGKTLPPIVNQVLASESKSFYDLKDGERTYFDLASGEHRPVPVPEGVLPFDTLKAASNAVRSNKGASVWDLGDGVAMLEIHSKANSLDQDVFDMIGAALESTAADFDALVIGASGDHFSVGANLQMILGLSMEKRWDELRAAIANVQRLFVSLRTFPKPVVGAVFGRTLAGGCEISLRCDHVQAAAESYIGLVEVGVGLIPAGGGCAEMVRRWNAGLTENDDMTRGMIEVFDTIGMAKVANSAAESRDWRYLRSADDITMNRDRLLAEAKQAALGLVAGGYEPPEPSPILVGGRALRAALDLRVWMMRQAAWATDYDQLVGKKLANILAGGDLTQPSFVDEDYLLGLEREAFLSLCGEERTQQRIEHILKTGRPLRN